MLLLTVALVATVAAAPRPPISPEETAYREVALAFDRDREQAPLLIAAAKRQFAGSRSCWMWGLDVLNATPAIGAADWKAAKQILDPPPPARCAASEPAVKRLVLRAWIAGSHDKPFKADILAAKRLAAALGPEVRLMVEQVHASLLTVAGNYPRAEKIAEAALASAHKRNLKVIEAKLEATLARVQSFQERLDEATESNERALALAKELGLHVLEAQAMANLAWAYQDLGHFELADQRAAAADQLAESLRRPQDRIGPIMQRGNARRSQERFDEAAEFYRKALEIATAVNDSRIGQCLANLALVALDKRDYAAAANFNTRALRLKNETGDVVSIQRSRLIEGRIAAGLKQFKTAYVIYRDVLASASAPSIKWEATGRLAMLDAATGQAALAEQNFKAVLRTADTVRQNVSREELRLGFEAIVREFHDAYIDFLIGQKRVTDALGVAETARARTLAEGLHIREEAQNRDARKVAADAGAVILSYWLEPEHSYLWVITAKSVELVALPDGRAINKAVQAYQQQLLAMSPPLSLEGASLYRMLVKPAEPWLVGAPRVVIVPDGALSAFNMEALVVPGAKPHYWIYDATIFTASSLRFVGGARVKVKAGALLLVGNAVQCDRDYPPLANAATEMDRVGGHFDRVRRIEEKEATPAAYKRTAVETFDVLHFVAHGVPNRAQPLQSAVVLSCDPRDRAFKLYAHEIMQRPLHAQLVTISSCHSAGNQAYSGEGLVGLAWAFLRAGAKEVVAALWEVNDSGTPVLMNDFYAQIRAGQDAPTALRAAKLKLMARGGGYQRPLYWAPFMLYSGA